MTGTGCASVAIEWSAPQSVPGESRASVIAGPGDLSVLTINMQLLPPPLGNTSEGRERVRRIVEIIRLEPGRYDILCLTEVFDEKLRAELVRLLSPEFPYVVSRCDTTDWIRQDSGLCLFSRFPFQSDGEVPLLNFAAFDFEWTFTADMLVAKGVLGVPLAISPGHTLWVFVSHLQCDPSELGRFADVRADQLQRIRGFMNECLARTPKNTMISAILAGDLNVPGSLARDSECGRMLDILGGPRDLHAVCRPDEDGATCDAPGDLRDATGARIRLRFDYILVFDRLMAMPRNEGVDVMPLQVAGCTVLPLRHEGRPLSDHDAVLGRMATGDRTEVARAGNLAVAYSSE